ncbi:MAG: hypothetical protein AVDCRST_MAG56-6987 [uncultured Cytophagales bacterium]|uniref:DUF4261 domain-containing protein n=1 Tax=uncultured Cytophagales bacterium TaxID=158755 RepID=A0A6J4L4K4_9SPHI|nr:MAG: hypothetical protein AVDCRST_MAG56-6987 [uncultured Cytophagales bacterium]
MKHTITISRFKAKHQNRLTLIQALREYNPGMGLREAKEAMEKMLEGEPIVIEIEGERLEAFSAILTELNVEFQVGSPGSELEEIRNEPAVLMAQFLFEHPFELDQASILEELRKEFARVETGSAADESDKPFLYFFPDYSVTYGDKSAPAQCVIFVPENQQAKPEKFVPALQQSWHWPEAKEIVPKCKYAFHVLDFLSSGLPYKRRAEYYQKFITALIKATRPQAVHFGGSDKLVNPFAYALAVTEEEPDTLHGMMNVRFFNISNGAEGEMFMDTLGLHVLGLPDFQVRFTGLDPSEVSGLLNAYGNYIYEHGVVIQAGNTIQGLRAEDIWTCYFADALVGPPRAVIDLETNQQEDARDT